MDHRPTIPRFDNSYARLPDRFFQRVEAQPVAAPRLIKLNEDLAAELGLSADWLASPDGVAMLAGAAFPPGAEPIALAYAGHQFGNFVPQLGDGRALLVGEVIDRNGNRRDIQLKGSGPTRFSRNGDGRAALGPVLREYIVSEAMHALGIRTARSLAAVATGERVYRESKLPGAVVARVAASHIRIGTFQYFAARGDVEALKALADHSIERHYPQAGKAERPYLALLDSVVAAQAELIAHWMCVGFIHGVMNTDNMTISGETIDYGPCAFMDAYHPATVFSSIDQFGRYAYAAQPGIAVWNLARLAEALLPILHDDIDEAVKLAEAMVKGFQPRYQAAFHTGLRAKIGLATQEPEDVPLIADLLERMSRNQADFTLTFRGLADEAIGQPKARDQFVNILDFDDWAARWRERLAREPGGDQAARELMLKTNPNYIPRNHRVEEVIAAAVERQDFAPFEEMVAVVTKPFEEQPGMERYAQAPAEDERVLRTFCGT